MNKKITLLLLMAPFLLWKGSTLKAQDLHFSQYAQTPALINPALTGALSTLRATLIYKEQWKSVTVPYTTYGASIETRFHNKYQKKKGKHLPKSRGNTFKRFAGGLSFYSDEAGDGALGLIQINATVATFIPTGKKSALSIGAQASFIQRKINFSNLIFPDQYTGAGYDNSLSSGEDPAAQNFSYPDFGAGLNWNYGYDNPKSVSEKLKCNFGASLYHINQPDQLYLAGTSEKLNMKFIVHGDMTFRLTDSKLALVPSIIYVQQGPTKEMLEGIMLKFYFSDGPRYYGRKASSALSFGFTYRNKDAVIVAAMYEYGQYAFGVSYDLNVSLLRNASKVQGGPEFFFRFVTPNPFSTGKNPKRRYNLK